MREKETGAIIRAELGFPLLDMFYVESKTKPNRLCNRHYFSVLGKRLYYETL